MASYKISFKQSVEETLRSLPQAEAARVFTRIEALKDEPVPGQSIKLAGAQQLYRTGVGDWRVVYGFDKDAKQVIVHHIRRRRGVPRRTGRPASS
ncbi:MAG: type II toxin-antitoxin system mRNA interferase toxin, RelE/StbE family [Dehalococcoidia bacterium]